MHSYFPRIVLDRGARIPQGFYAGSRERSGDTRETPRLPRAAADTASLQPEVRRRPCMVPYAVPPPFVGAAGLHGRIRRNVALSPGDSRLPFPAGLRCARRAVRVSATAVPVRAARCGRSASRRRSFSRCQDVVPRRRSSPRCRFGGRRAPTAHRGHRSGRIMVMEVIGAQFRHDWP